LVLRAAGKWKIVSWFNQWKESGCGDDRAFGWSA
jgi:hypothetical protein